MKEINHPLTKAQDDYLRPLVDEVGSLQRQIQAFLDYIGAEANLPKPDDGWKLKIEPGGKAFLFGPAKPPVKE